MRFVRLCLIVAALAGAAGCTGAAANAAGVWVRVSPATIQPGSSVAIQASCGDNLNPATVTSPVFGTVTIQPVNGVLTATAQVPPTATGGTTKVTLTCSTGSRATTTLTVLGPTAARQTMGPATGGGFLANGGGGITPASLVWLALGLGAFAAAAAVGVRSKRRATVRARRTSR